MLEKRVGALLGGIAVFTMLLSSLERLHGSIKGFHLTFVVGPSPANPGKLSRNIQRPQGR